VLLGWSSVRAAGFSLQPGDYSSSTGLVNFLIGIKTKELASLYLWFCTEVLCLVVEATKRQRRGWKGNIKILENWFLP